MPDMRVSLRSGRGFLGIDPATGDADFPVYDDRPEAWSWERAELTAQGAGMFSVRFLAANRQLSLMEDGRFESRPAGDIGPFELVYATEQPDGTSFAYRFQDGRLVGVPLLVAEA